MKKAGRHAFCPERLDGTTEHLSSGAVFSARDLQRDKLMNEWGKAACVSRAGGFLLPKEAKCGIVCLAA